MASDTRHLQQDPRLPGLVDPVERARNVSVAAITVLLIGTLLAFLSMAGRVHWLVATLVYLLGFGLGFIAFFARLAIPREQRREAPSTLVASILAWATFFLINYALRTDLA